MPLYLNCPHCEHPQIVSVRRRGKAMFCRQCGRAYMASAKSDTVKPLPFDSIGDLQQYNQPQEQVFVLDA